MLLKMCTTSGSEQFPWAVHLLLRFITGCASQGGETFHQSKDFLDHLPTYTITTQLAWSWHGCAWAWAGYMMSWFTGQVSLELLPSFIASREPVSLKDSQMKVHQKYSQKISAESSEKFLKLLHLTLYDLNLSRVLSDVWFGLCVQS